jgi:prepilin-type N-terminal cleavage/methylation domain-containing protein
MKVTTSRKSGFTLVEIMIVVAIIGLLAAIAIPNFIKARESSQKNACIANMKQLEGAVQTWALENGWKTGDPAPAYAAIVGAAGYITRDPHCPNAPAALYATFTPNAAPVCPAAVATHVLQ